MTLGKLNHAQVKAIIDYLENALQEGQPIDATDMAYDISDLIEERQDTTTLQIAD